MPHWTESLGVHDLPRTLEVAERLAATYECTTPAYGAPGHAHCAACCYGTGIAASSMEEFETGQVLCAVPGLIHEIERLRERVSVYVRYIDIVQASKYTHP